MPLPRVDGGLLLAERALEVAQHADVVQRVDVAPDQRANSAYPRAGERISGQKWRLGVSLLQIFQDGWRLDQHRPAEVKRRHAALRADGQISGRALLFFQEMDRCGLVSE